MEGGDTSTGTGTARAPSEPTAISRVSAHLRHTITLPHHGSGFQPHTQYVDGLIALSFSTTEPNSRNGQEGLGQKCRK